MRTSQVFAFAALATQFHPGLATGATPDSTTAGAPALGSSATTMHVLQAPQAMLYVCQHTEPLVAVTMNTTSSSS